MQSSVPELTDLSDEPESTFELYGPDSRESGTFARNCLLARRLAERDVRFIQLFHRGWDQHTRLPRGIELQAQDVDQGQAALVTESEEPWVARRHAGRLGRRVRGAARTAKVCSPRRPTVATHHPRGFTIWMAGGGVKPGTSYGETDDFSYNIASNPVHIHDLHATLLHLLGIDHSRLDLSVPGPQSSG